MSSSSGGFIKAQQILRDVFKTTTKKLQKIQKPKSWTPILLVLLFIAVFLLGMLVTKIQYLEQNGTNIPPTPAGNTQQTQKAGPMHIAQAIGMDADKFKSCLENGKYAKNVQSDLSDGQKAGVSGTPSVFINGNLFVGAEPYTTFKQALDQELANPSSPLPSVTQTQVGNGPFPVMGNANATVKIVEFADFQCPFCEQFYTQTESQIITDYVKTGKAAFYFDNYAFLGPDSTTLAEGAYCAQEQGKFWQYHNFIYSHQGQENSGWASEKNLL
ncbi:MAG TPA: thioredoxin domain-containing protein [Patescibacteria group bacterium]|nr:thioredoxin domain-containing protein [Patescibacteria group bacterium]